MRSLDQVRVWRNMFFLIDLDRWSKYINGLISWMEKRMYSSSWFAFLLHLECSCASKGVVLRRDLPTLQSDERLRNGPLPAVAQMPEMEELRCFIAISELWTSCECPKVKPPPKATDLKDVESGKFSLGRWFSVCQHSWVSFALGMWETPGPWSSQSISVDHEGMNQRKWCPGSSPPSLWGSGGEGVHSSYLIILDAGGVKVLGVLTDWARMILAQGDGYVQLGARSIQGVTPNLRKRNAESTSTRC